MHPGCDVVVYLIIIVLIMFDFFIIKCRQVINVKQHLMNNVSNNLFENNNILAGFINLIDNYIYI